MRISRKIIYLHQSPLWEIDTEDKDLFSKPPASVTVHMKLDRTNVCRTMLSASPALGSKAPRKTKGDETVRLRFDRQSVAGRAEVKLENPMSREWRSRWIDGSPEGQVAA